MNTLRESWKTIGILSVCHALVDFLCIFSLFRNYGSLPETILLYNFCAFALQMPLGILLDHYTETHQKKSLPALLFTMTGILLTIAGSFVSPVISGIGNAFFHSGGGVLTIFEDRRSSMKGRGLGVFVAPGAVGLTLALLSYHTDTYGLIRLAASAVLLLAGFLAYVPVKNREYTCPDPAEGPVHRGSLWVFAACGLVVILRSMSGMGIVFSWKSGALITLASTVCLAAGKSAGGFIAAHAGIRKTTLCSLSAAAVCYAFGSHLIPGLAALFLFNMTMPLTLYLLAEEIPAMPGFAFGILTFCLFAGCLPVWYGTFQNMPPFPAGCILSVISLILLYLAERGQS